MNKKILLLSWLFINFAFATVPASVDRSDIAIGQSFTLTIDITNTNSNPDLTALNNNFNVFGTNSTTQTDITNGHMSSQKSYIINLSPKNSGQQTIPAIKVGNDTTAPITINVTEPSKAEQALQKSQIFVEAKVNNQTTYIGVPLIYTLKLYYSVGISNVRISNIEVKKATFQQLDKASQYSENIKGTNYQVYEQKLQITPNQTGDITIPQVNISGITADNSDGFLNQLQPKPFNIAAKAINIKVKPIPAGISASEWFPAKQVNINESKPSGGGSTTLKLGQPITRTIIIQALGVPFTSIPEIKLTTPNNVNAYPDKTATNNSFSGNDLLSTKVFKVAYIPTRAGDVEFPETTIKWWDITSNSLKTAVIPGKTYTILNENGSTLDTSSTTASQTPELKTPVTHPKKNTVSNQSNKIWLYMTILFAVLWLATLITMLILLRKKPKINQPNNNVENNKLSSQKKALELIHSAARAKDITALNTALVQWATIYWHKKIYTVLDIRDLSTNQVLNKLLDKFNQTLYRGTAFEKFDDLAHEIDKLGCTKPEKSNSGLKELYPE